MLIRNISDLHLECQKEFLVLNNMRDAVNALLVPLETDKDTVLVMAGDIGTICNSNEVINFMRYVVPRFKHIFYTLGNTENFNCALDESANEMLQKLAEASIDVTKITIAGNIPKVIVIDDVTFIGGTLWTNYFDSNLEAMMVASEYLSDFSLIFKSMTNRVYISPRDLINIFDKTIAFFKEMLLSSTNKKVIITHHIPSLQAIDERYRIRTVDKLLNGAFASHLEDFILEHKPDYWFFGHTHKPFDSMIGGTRLICNPGGYPHEDNLNTGRYSSTVVYEV